MFRWTAGTKARADRAARQHGLGGGVGRLLLTSRPLHATQCSCVPPPTTKTKTESQIALPIAHKASPEDSHKSFPETCVGAERAASTEEANNTQKQTASDASFGTVTKESETASDATAPSLGVMQKVVTPDTAASHPLWLSENESDDALCPPHVSRMTCASSAAAHLSLQPSEPLPAPSTTHSKQTHSFVAPLSLSHADRLVHAMMEAKRRGRKRCRAHNRERHHHRHHYRTSDESGKSCASNCDGQLGGEASATDGFDAERSGSDCSNAACSLRLETAMDTYGMLQRQRQQVETKERQHRLRNEACALTAEAVKDAPQRHTVNRHGHRDVLLKAAASCGPVSGSTRAAALPGVSVDCVSVQLPLRRGKQTALCATGSRSPSTVATAGSTGCPRVGRQGWHLSSTHTPAFASAQRAACVSRGDVSALAQTLRSRSTGDWSEWSTSTTAQGEAPGGAAMIEVAVDAHRCHRDNASAGSRNTEDDEQAAPADMPLFQDTSESLTYPFASPTAGGATTFSSASCMAAKCGLPTRALWDTDSFFARRAAAPSMMQFDAADHPRDWSLQCSSASQNPQYFSARGGEDTNLWAVPLVEEERWPDAASPLAPPPPTGNAIPSQTMPSNWPLPPATSVSAKRFPWNMEPGGMGGAPALEIPCEHQHTAHPSFTPPSSFPWLAPSLSPQNASSGDLRRYESRELPDHGGVWLIQPPASLPFGSSVLPDVPTATADAASNSAFPRGVLPWVPAPPRDDAHQQHNSPWLSQHHSQLPQEGVRPHFLPPAPQLQRHTPSLGEARRTGSSAQRGGAGQQRRQRPAPLRALNRTTERCRRFWERCRHPPDSHPAPSP